MQTIDFPLILFYLTLVTGVIYLADRLFWAKKRKFIQTDNEPFLIKHSKAFFPIFLIVLLIRSLLVSLFYVPTGSLEPTVKPVEFLAINRFAYGLKMPVWHFNMMNVGEPERGDIAVFRWPVNPHIDFIKRVIGLPGDKISYINKKLYINGKPVSQRLLGIATDKNGPKQKWQVQIFKEFLPGKIHLIYRCPQSSLQCPGRMPSNFYNLTVPKGEYFVMGDNRDDSDDSRGWGFVPASAFIGRALMVVFSWDKIHHRVRWSRIGTQL